MKIEKSRFLPSSLTLYITYRCGSRCQHCFLVERGLLNQHEMTLQQIQQIIDDAARHKVFLLLLAGGDPLLHPDFEQIVIYARSKQLLPLLSISGHHVSDEQVVLIKRLGFTTVQVSLDGASDASNDVIRGAGSFQGVLYTVRRLQSVGIKVNVALTIHAVNMGQVESLLTLLHAVGASRVKLGFYFASGSSSAFSPLTADQQGEVVDVARAFMAARQNPDWIACPTHELQSGLSRSGRRRHPPLCVGADGVLSAGEDGEVIGSLYEGALSATYTRFASAKLEAFLHRLCTELFAKFTVRSVTAHPTLRADAVVYRDQGFHLVVKEGLSSSLHYFALLHEIGHIATGTLHENPHTRCVPEYELAANLWALQALESALTPSSFNAYVRAAHQGHAPLLRRVEECLLDDLIAYN